MDKLDLPGASVLEGEDQDVCSFFASIINQRQSVERLLNWLRESQTTCTDTNCFDELGGLPGNDHEGPLGGAINDSETGAFALVLWFVAGLLTLYAMNLSRNRDLNRGVETKARHHFNDSDEDDHAEHRRNNRDDDHSSPAI